MTDSTQIVYESFLTCSPTGPPRSLHYFSAIVFHAGVMADAYLVEGNHSGSAASSSRSEVMHYVAQASPQLVLEWMGQQQNESSSYSSPPSDTQPSSSNHLCGIFIRDPPPPNEEQQQQQHRQQHPNDSFNRSLMDTPGAIPFSSQSRLLRQRQQQQQQQAEQDQQQSRAAEEEAHCLPSHSFLAWEQVETLVKAGGGGGGGGGANSPSSSDQVWSGVLFLVDVPRRNFLFNLCECQWFGGKLSTVTYRVALRQLDDPTVPLSQKCDVVLEKPSSSSSNNNNNQSSSSLSPSQKGKLSKSQQLQKASQVMLLSPDSHEKLRITKILSNLSTPVQRMCRELMSGVRASSSSGNVTHVSGKFFLLFCPEDDSAPSQHQSAAAAGPPGEVGATATAGSNHFYQELDQMKHSYSKGTVGSQKINWKPLHMTTTTSSSPNSKSSGIAAAQQKQQQQQQQHQRTNQHFGTSITTQNHDRDKSPGEWFFLGAQSIQGPLRAAVQDFLEEQRPDRLALMRMIEEEDAAAAATAAASAERQRLLQVQRQEQQQQYAANISLHSPLRRDNNSSHNNSQGLPDDDDISWDADVHRTGGGSRVGSAHVTSDDDDSRPVSPTLRAATQTNQGSSGRPPRPSSTTIININNGSGGGVGGGASFSVDDDNNSDNNSAAATRASSAALSHLGAGAASGSVVHKIVVPGALVMASSSELDDVSFGSPNGFHQQQQQQQRLPSIHEMWERRLRTGGPRRAIVTSSFDRAMRKEQQQQQLLLNNKSAAATPTPQKSRSNQQLALLASPSTPPPPASHNNNNSLAISSSFLSPSDVASKQLRLPTGTTFGPVPSSSKKVTESKFLSRLSRFLDGEQGRLVQKLVDEDDERARKVALEAQAADAASAAERYRREECERLRTADEQQAALLAAQREREAAAAKLKGRAATRSRAEMRRLLLMRSAASNVTPLEKIKNIYDVSSFHLALETAYMDLFSEKLEKVPSHHSVDGVSLSPTAPPTTTSKRQVRLPSEIRAREAVDFFADVGIMAEYEVPKESDDDDDDNDSDNNDGDERSNSSSRSSSSSSSSPAPRHGTDSDDDDDGLNGSSRNNKKKNKNQKSKASPLQLALAGCAPMALVTIFVPDSSRVAARLLASTLWKAESIVRAIDKLNRWQLDTWWHMYEHGTASLHRCLDLVLFQQEEQQQQSSTSLSPSSSPTGNNNNNNAFESNVFEDSGGVGGDADKQQQQDKAAEEEEEGAQRKAEEQAAAMKAHAARLMQIQSFLRDEDARRGKLLQMEQTQRGLILSMENDHGGFLKAMFPEWVAAAVVQKRRENQHAAGGGGASGGGFIGGGGGGGIDSPALNLMAEAAAIRKEMDLLQQEERQLSESNEEKWRRDLAVQEVEGRIELEKMQTNSRNGALQKQQVREKKAEVERELALVEQERKDLIEKEREQRHLAARGGGGAVASSRQELLAEIRELRGLLLSGLIRQEEAVARGRLVRGGFDEAVIRMQQLFAAAGARNKMMLFQVNTIFIIMPDEKQQQQHDEASTTSSSLLLQLAVGPVPAVTFGHTCLLRDTVIETTLFSQEQLTRSSIEGSFASEMREQLLPSLCSSVAVAAKGGSSRSAVARRARWLLQVERVCALENSGRCSMCIDAVQQVAGMARWFSAGVLAIRCNQSPPPLVVCQAADGNDDNITLQQLDRMVGSAATAAALAASARKQSKPRATTAADVRALRMLLEETTALKRESAARSEVMVDFWFELALMSCLV